MNTPIGHPVYTHGQILRYRGIDWNHCVFIRGKAMLHPYAKIRNLTEAEWASLKP